jgi:release factor glutamine methyltransferase
MTVKKALEWATKELEKAHTHDPAGCAKFLLRHALEKALSSKQSAVSIDTLITTDPDLSLNTYCLSLFRQMIDRRVHHEPVWYITNEAFFWRDIFFVDEHVLIPRPETELVVFEAQKIIKKRYKDRRYTIADIGTGCGAIALSLARELGSRAKIYATDISADAIEVAKINAKKLRVQSIKFLTGDALDPLQESVDLIVGNPPYIETGGIGGLSYDIHHFEPRVALDGGQDGLDVHRQILREAAAGKLKKGGVVVLEIGWNQGKKIAGEAKKYFPKAKISVGKDYDGNDRVLVVVT